MITLSIMGYTGKAKASIQIFDLEGKKKYNDQISCVVTCPRTLINIDERFPSGTYVIYVTIDGKVFTQRLIVK